MVDAEAVETAIEAILMQRAPVALLRAIITLVSFEMATDWKKRVLNPVRLLLTGCTWVSEVALESGHRSGDFEVKDAGSQRFSAIPDLGPGVRSARYLCGSRRQVSRSPRREPRYRLGYSAKILKELRRRAQKTSADIDIAPPGGRGGGGCPMFRDETMRWGLEILARVEQQRELIEEASTFCSTRRSCLCDLFVGSRRK